MTLPFAESYLIKAVQPIKRSTRQEREQWLKDAHYNVFSLRSNQVYIDMLTDSSCAMSSAQWASMMVGDESYAGSLSYYRLAETVEDILGFKYFLPSHQGRGAENVLHFSLTKQGDVIPGNAHFMTTVGHIEIHKARAVDCTIDEAFDIDLIHPFKGNLDIEKLQKVITQYGREKIPMIVITLTCNTTGGQPVSIGNIKQVSKLARQYDIPICYDAARFAENAYFIKMREKAYKDKTIAEIVKEMFSYADIVTISAKKDALANTGGILGFRDHKLFEKASAYNVLFEGFVTYGGMTGRDMNAVAVGLRESIELDFLETRVRQVEFLADKLTEYNIPLLKPTGGHAVYIDARRMLKHIPMEELRSETLACELYLEAGIRGLPIGHLSAGRDPLTMENKKPKLELLRLALPRRMYTNCHMEYAAAAVRNIISCCNKFTGLKVTHEPEILRIFTAKMDAINKTREDKSRVIEITVL